MGNTKVTERKIEVHNEGRRFTAVLMEPETLNPDPILVVEAMWEAFASGGGEAFHARALSLGHRIVGLDIPQEGERVDSYGSGIQAMNAAVAAGRDIFGEFSRDGSATIERLIADGLAKSGRIVVVGISRSAFCVAHMMAADARISAGGFCAPVTTLSSLVEFKENVSSEAVTRLDLWHLAGRLAGRRIWLGIGHRDIRVDTAAACRFYMALREAEGCPFEQSKIHFFITEDDDHSFGANWYARAAEDLLGPGASH